MNASIRLRLFEQWFSTAKPGATFIYHRGELARDKREDPALSELADRMLHVSTGRFDVVSACGHIRGKIIGSGQVELVTRREQGTMTHLARRLP